MGYDRTNITFVFFENQVRRLMGESLYDERKLEELKASCFGQSHKMFIIFFAHRCKQPIPQGSRLSNAKEYVEPPAFDAEKVRTFVP